MPDFRLYDIDPVFLARLKAKAAREGTTLSRVIFALLAEWLNPRRTDHD
jgi:hypothetical protein